MRYVLVGMLSVAALKCREIQPLTPVVTVHGYQINGTVSTPNGVPLAGVEVILYYNYVFADPSPADTQAVVLVDSTLFVDISVYTIHNVYIGRLFGGFRSPGVIPHPRWNGFDNMGNLVPSGKYLIRYEIGLTVVKETPVLIEGHTTAMTDGNGRFTLTNDNLPIGEQFDIYKSNGSYDTTVLVLSTVDLEFKKLDLDRTYSVVLTKDQITNGVFTLQ